MRRPDKIRRPGDPARGIEPYDVFQIRLRQPNGRMKCEIYRTKKEALRASRDHEDKLEKGIDTQGRTVNQAEDEMLKAFFGTTTSLRQATVNQANQAAAKIRAEFGTWPLTKVHQRHIEDWRDRLVKAAPDRHAAQIAALKAKLLKISADKRAVRARRRLAALTADGPAIAARLARTGPRAANKALAHLRRLYKFAQERRYVTFNPTDGVRMAKAPRSSDRPIDTNVLSVEEIGALVAATDAEHRAALLVLAYAGLRVGELVGLTWGDLELTRRRLRVAQQRESSTGNITTPKTNAGIRFVELPGVVVAALREHELRTKMASPEFVFPYHVRRFRDGVFFPALRRARLRRIRLHDLRHTAASLMIATGADIATVSRQLGHANVSITLGIYTHAFARRAEPGIGAKMDELIKAENSVVALVVALDDFAGEPAEAGAA
jgi:integrase